ncbi:MAG: hypothetical protein ACXWCS_07320 [Burkholderiales bacterium]
MNSCLTNQQPCATGSPRRRAPRDDRLLRKRSIRGLLAIVAIVAAAGCATPPDAGNLADASAQLRSAIAATGNAVAVELDAAGEPDRARQLREVWVVPDRSAVALMLYSDAVANIVRSGQQGGDTVRRLADAGTQLATGVGIALPAAGAVAAGVDLAAYLYQQIALARAATSLEQSLERMQPAVDRIADVIGKQLDDAQTILVNANKLAEVKLRDQFSDETGYLLALRKERQALYRVTPLTTANADRLLQIEKVERSVTTKLEPMEAERKAAAVRMRNSLQLIAATRQAVIDWAGAHRQMLAAVRDGATVDPQALVQSVFEVRELIRKVRAQ